MLVIQPPYNNGQVLPVHAVNYDFQELEGRVKRSTQGSKACQIIKVEVLQKYFEEVNYARTQDKEVFEQTKEENIKQYEESP
ncbi:hypothetical protein Tco_0291898 [Tanacetum coccineum]